MEEFIRLSQVLERSENSIKEQAEQITSLQQQEVSCEENISKQQRTQWELEKKLEHLAELKGSASALRQIISENDRIREEIAAIELAQDTLKELSMSIRDSFGLYLNKTASELISGITGGLYTSMSIDENLGAFLKHQEKAHSSGTGQQRHSGSDLPGSPPGGSPVYPEWAGFHASYLRRQLHPLRRRQAETGPAVAVRGL